MRGGKLEAVFNMAGSGLSQDDDSITSYRRDDKTKLPSPVTLRLTAEERLKLEELAQGMSMSAYIRACVFQNEVSQRKRVVRVPVKDKAALAELLGLLGQSRIANNLNQLAYHANIGSLPVDESTIAQIEESYESVCMMRGLLLRSLGLREPQ